MSKEHYFDNAATTPVDPRVVEEMLPFLTDDFANANSGHSLGSRARAAVEVARGRVAELLGCAPDEFVFTSGATEANNWVLQSFQSVAVSPFEHSSIWEQATHLGYTILGNSGYELDPPSEDIEIVSVMDVNNETGAIVKWPPPGHGSPSPLVHRDMTQSVGKIPANLASVDFASMSAHKLYGPKGVGGLYIKGGQPFEPLLYGGEHERGMRSGTLNVPGIVGFGAACSLAMDRMESSYAHAKSLREAVLSSLQKVPDWQDNTSESNSPYVLSVSFLGVEGESLVIAADFQGFALGSGPACSSGSPHPSRTLTALGMDPQWSRGTVRISFSHWNTIETAKNLGLVLSESVTKLRSLGK